MSGFPRAASRRSYSWWWDSHIGPKNSKWLQENLTDIDAKVKSMIKLIEEDGDSFARRAEMYYKKRPELMKLVEEFYRAYRALAERYDNATGVLKQAQKTMIEAFPNQDLMGIIDDPADSTTSPPDIPSPLLAQLGEGRVRKTLNFRNTESLSESEKVSNFEREIQSLKDALAKLEAEKVAGETQYDQTLQKLNKLELEVSCSQENSRNLSIVAKKTEGEVEALQISLTKLEAEKEASLRQYEKSLEMISNLENNASQAKEEVEELRKWAVKLESEKDEAHDQYKQSLEMISNLENKLELVEEEAKQVRERADNAEKEVQTLKQALAKLTEENTSNVLLYHQCLEKISILEQKLFFAEEEVMRLKGEIDTSVTKLKGAEEQCLTLQKSNESLNLEMGSLVLKMGSQSEELTEKQKELGKIWTCLEEERLRFVEAETNFQKLQHLYSQTQEQMKSLGLEIENKGQLLKDKETQNESLLDEITRTNEENKSLNDVNVTSSISIGQMQNEISCLVESNEKFESSVKQLQTDNSDLKYTFEKEKAEKLLLLEKLAIMEQLIHKNALLEKSLSDLTAELEGARLKINDLEQSFEALLEEKSTILAEKATVMSQLQVMIENLEKIIEKNNFLENSLSDARGELDGLKTRSITLEASCESLEKEKFYLINEKDALISEGKTTQQTLESLEKRQRELEERYLGLENERESTSSKVDKLQISLDVEKKEHANFAQRTETQLAGMGQQILLLQEEVFSRRREFEDELDKAMNYQLEIFIVRRCVEDLREKNSSLLAECQKLAEGSIISEKVISELKHDNSEMLSKIEDTNNSLHQVLDDNQKLNVEMSVIVTLLGQLRLEAKSLDMKRVTLERELETKNEELILSQNEATKLLELNGDLNLKISSLTFLLVSLSKEIDEIKVVRNDQENEINKLKNLHEEFGLMTRLSETEAATMFEELQYSTVFQALLEENFYKLKNKAILKDEKIEVLEKKINNLEGVNGGVVAQLAGYAPLLMSLKDSVSSLESLTLHNRLQKSHNEGAKEVDPVSNENLNSAQNALNVNSELNDLQFRIKVIEKAMVQKERENIEANNKLEAAMKTIDDLKFKGGLNREYSVPISDNSELENEISTKDIILDVNSESSSHELSKKGERKSQRKMDRSWDSADLDRSFNLSIGRDNRVKSPPREMLKRQKSRYRNSEIVAEKELGIDKLQISRSFSQRSQEVTKTKILERLNSDAEKLTNLQIAVQDLMKKTKIIENGKKGKSVYESDTLRDQLEEAEEAILELSEYNDKLIRSAEKRSFSSNVKSGLDSEESGRARRRRISEQAKKVSEKIGRLQLEVQKIQFVLMKIDNEKNESNVKSRFSEMRRKVMLRDYLYGVRSPSHQLKKKKSTFCGCIQPPTRGD